MAKNNTDERCDWTKTVKPPAVKPKHNMLKDAELLRKADNDYLPWPHHSVQPFNIIIIIWSFSNKEISFLTVWIGAEHNAMKKKEKIR